jgi:chromatin assembly factor 1 subunit B
MVYAVATQDGVLIYDTQHANAIVMSNKIHYASITDLSWSSDGYTLGVSSSDGYCSFMTFDRSDLGDPLSSEGMFEVLNDRNYVSNSSNRIDGCYEAH